jgi:hypothetical protein
MQLKLGGAACASLASQQPGFLFDRVAACRSQSLDQSRGSMDEQTMIHTLQSTSRDIGR